MERLVIWLFWLVVGIGILGALPWLLGRLTMGSLVVLVVLVGAGMTGRHLRRHGG